MAAFQNCAAFAHQCPHALTVTQGWSFLDPVLRALGRAPESTENRCVTAKIDCIIAPISSCDHPAVKIEYLG